MTSVKKLTKYHINLLSKLHYYGIRNYTLSWIGALLSNRIQTTVVKGVHSSYAEVFTSTTSRLPLGSVLGPMLFLLYMNDIDKIIIIMVIFKCYFSGELIALS